MLPDSASDVPCIDFVAGFVEVQPRQLVGVTARAADAHVCLIDDEDHADALIFRRVVLQLLQKAILIAQLFRFFRFAPRSAFDPLASAQFSQLAFQALLLLPIVYVPDMPFTISKLLHQITLEQLLAAVRGVALEHLLHLGRVVQHDQHGRLHLHTRVHKPAPFLSCLQLEPGCRHARLQRVDDSLDLLVQFLYRITHVLRALDFAAAVPDGDHRHSAEDEEAAPRGPRRLQALADLALADEDVLDLRHDHDMTTTYGRSTTCGRSTAYGRSTTRRTCSFRMSWAVSPMSSNRMPRNAKWTSPSR